MGYLRYFSTWIPLPDIDNTQTELSQNIWSIASRAPINDILTIVERFLTHEKSKLHIFQSFHSQSLSFLTHNNFSDFSQWAQEHPRAKYSMFETSSQTKENMHKYIKENNKNKNTKYEHKYQNGMYASLEWNKNIFNIKRTTKSNIFIFFMKNKVSINTKVLCQCPVKSLTCHILIYFPLE